MIFDVIFSDFFGWDWGTPAILRQNPNKITVLCGCGFKKLGLGQTPAPLVGTKYQFFFCVDIIIHGGAISVLSSPKGGAVKACQYSINPHPHDFGLHDIVCLSSTYIPGREQQIFLYKSYQSSHLKAKLRF